MTLGSGEDTEADVEDMICNEGSSDKLREGIWDIIV